MTTSDPILFLWDIDGTLLRAGTDVHKAAFTVAFTEVYGVPLSLDGISAGGRTDTWLMAEPLRRHGMSDAEIWEHMPRAFAVMEQYVDAHLGNLRHRVAPGIPELLRAMQARGHVLGLLTGNLRAIAFAKMHHAGLDDHFGVGGFGGESEVRAHLVPVAIADAARVSGHAMPPHRVVVIGDTALDVEAGKANGTRTVAVATGMVSHHDLQLSGADLLFHDFSDGQAALQALEELVA